QTMNASMKFTIGNWIDPLPTMALDGVGGYNGRQVLQSRPPCGIGHQVKCKRALKGRNPRISEAEEYP
ncbi:MAG: hypothetical protein SV375_18000, partial [Thermodesulfobacteriota bacterium]|nr:hypothetical protein [Thermodesulfobacteriota bacterium]